MAYALLLVTTTLPDPETAHHLAEWLVDERLAACVQVGEPVTSTYRWQGRIETNRETPLIIKTTTDRYPALEAFLQAHHPYTLPEIIATPATCGLTAYLDWVHLETHRDTPLDTQASRTDVQL